MDASLHLQIARWNGWSADKVTETRDEKEEQAKQWWTQWAASGPFITLSKECRGKWTSANENVANHSPLQLLMAGSVGMGDKGVGCISVGWSRFSGEKPSCTLWAFSSNESCQIGSETKYNADHVRILFPPPRHTQREQELNYPDQG